MATDLERLVVQMSADFKSYEAAFAKASGITRQQLAVIKADAANTGKVTEVAFTGAARGVHAVRHAGARRAGQRARACRRRPAIWRRSSRTWRCSCKAASHRSPSLCNRARRSTRRSAARVRAARCGRLAPRSARCSIRWVGDDRTHRGRRCGGAVFRQRAFRRREVGRRAEEAGRSDPEGGERVGGYASGVGCLRR